MTDTGVYPSHWEVDAVASDGGTVHVRPIRADDASRIQALHARLSDETIYLRFFSPMRELSDKMLHRLVNVDYADRMALVAELGDEIIAVARYDRLTGSHEAEVAFVVDDVHQGRGLGTLLLEHLVVIARTHGITRFVAETLPHNEGMLRVFQNAGYAVKRHFDGGVVDVSFPIEPTLQAERLSEERDHHAVAASMSRFLSPGSVAVVGASRQPGTAGHEVVRNLLHGGFAGPVYPVNPAGGTVAGVTAYPSLADVPGPVDLAVIAVPAGQVEEVVVACAVHGVRGLVVVARGFSDIGPEGRERERRITEFARLHGMRLVGPNGMGIVNTDPAVRLNASFVAELPSPGRIGFLSQSGALGIAVLGEAEERRLGVSSFVSVGNKADVSGNDLLQYWEDDPRTDVILLYLESFGNPRKFARIARRVARAKPIVAVKANRRLPRGAIPVSHTAALATTDAAVDALFRQAGVTRVATLDQLFDVAQAFVHQPVPKGPRVAIVGSSGGPGILAADAAEEAGLDVVELSAATQRALRELLPGAATVRNPVDVIPESPPEVVEAALGLVLDDPVVDSAIVIHLPPLPGPDEEVRAAIGRVSAAHPETPVLATLPASVREIVTGDHHVPAYRFPESAVLALARMTEHGVWLSRAEGAVPVLPGFDHDRIRTVVDGFLAARPIGGWLEPERAFALLDAAGIPVARPVYAGSAAEAAAAASLIGYPVALKTANPSLVRKVEQGGVALDLQDASAVVHAFREMMHHLGERMAGAIVQPMVPNGIELVVGITDDASFGQIVVLGSGGPQADLLRDRVLRILPVTDVDAREMVRGLRISPLMFGRRDASSAVDTAAVEDLVLRIAELAEAVPEIEELNLNPVIVTAAGLVAVDVTLLLAPDLRHHERTLRRLR
jgi:acyl-CoA synthetase (NDP forming)/RimJ/RimL family protein N-acetyltransferase